MNTCAGGGVHTSEDTRAGLYEHLSMLRSTGKQISLKYVPKVKRCPVYYLNYGLTGWSSYFCLLMISVFTPLQQTHMKTSFIIICYYGVYFFVEGFFIHL